MHCRRALALAIDYETMLRMIAITDDVSGGSAPVGAIPVGMLGYNADGAPLAQDMDAARAEMAQCAYDPAEHTLEVSWIAEVPLEERFALLAQANFSELGFNTEIVRMPWALFAEAVSNVEATPHFSQLFNSTITDDPDTLFYGMYHSSAAGTWQSPEYLADDEVDALLEAGRTETDTDARADIYSQLDARLMDLAPTIFGYDRQSVFAASNRVRVPALTDPAMAFGMDTLGFSFRLMEMVEE